MRRFLLCVASLGALLALARAEVPALLGEALKKTGEDEGNWAYTETSREIDQKGRSGGETIVRFDPSKPYAEQFTPLKIEGKPPTARQRKEYRKRGEKRGVELERAAMDAQAAGASENAEIALGGEGVVPELEKAKIVSDEGAVVSYEIPLRKTGRSGPPVEKFQLVIRVNKERHDLEAATVRLLAPVRVMLVAKVTSGELKAEFAVVDPNFPPVMTSFGGNLAGSLFFVKSGATFAENRTDFVRVKPYGDRFQVKVGPLKALPF
ncbi:MAG TPA: hypothetical protein VM029_04650 [Opitutaceae bacterium]|nr:hypothetical protein [Opitutaceae bacterium]